ncbi:MAG: trehalase family glycosidase [Candidatus Saccharimonadales bacterium]
MVIHRAHRIKHKIEERLLSPKSKNLAFNDVEPALEYINNYWRLLTRYHPKDEANLIGLPNKFIVPSVEGGAEFDYNEQYYWDSFFIVKGLLNEKNKKLNLGILDNLIFLFKEFGIIPNASRLYLTSRSQPPILTSLIFDLYDTYRLDNDWLKDKIEIAIKEYNYVWLGTTKPNARKIYRGLSRYYDFNYINDIAETESGWDMTPRFYRKALSFLPIDLQALLYKYETDFARYYKITGNQKEEKKWKGKAKIRKEITDELMWDNVKGLYFDYNFEKKRRGGVSSLASFYPMWANMVTEKQAAKLVKALKKFEYSGGLATTDSRALRFLPISETVPTQWAYPNGWAPLHYIVTEGLNNYGYYDDAERIASKWLRTNLSWFEKNGVFLEKYNVVNPGKPPEKGLYPSQTGFGWTNSIFTYLAKKYVRVESD